MAREGYLIVDHTASPGIPEDVALALGMDPDLVREGKRFEAATMTCAHCKTAVIKNPKRTRERTYCAKCGGRFICDDCALLTRMPDYTHTPFEQRVDLGKEAGAKGIPFHPFGLHAMGSPFELLAKKG